MIRAITLDLDDTLWAIAPVIRRAEARLWQWLGEHYPQIAEDWTSEALLELRGRIANEHPDRVHDFRFLRKRVLRQVATKSGYPANTADAAFDVFDAARNDVELFDDVRPVLQWLAHNFVVVALTNGNANLQRIGIAEYFDHTVTAVDVGVAKPDPRIFDAAITAAGVAASDVLHVGDDPQTDIAGAQGAGLRTAWINRRQEPWPAQYRQPDIMVTSLLDLQQTLRVNPALATA